MSPLVSRTTNQFMPTYNPFEAGASAVNLAFGHSGMAGGGASRWMGSIPTLSFPSEGTSGAGGSAGFGSDPNYIHSFVSSAPVGAQALSRQDAFSSLRDSLAYKQAGMDGKQRMERAVGMGLPANTDLNKVQKIGINPSGFGPIYAAPRPQPWGPHGSIGINN